MKTSVVAQLPLLTCTLTRTNCTQSQVDTCSIVQFYGKLKYAKEDGEVRNDLFFCYFEVTGYFETLTTGSILTLADTYLTKLSLTTRTCATGGFGSSPIFFFQRGNLF